MSARSAGGEARGTSRSLRVSRGWSVFFVVLCTVGVCLSGDLLRLHVNVHTDPDYHSYCAMSERVNCETVAASDRSVVLGLPLALWGLLAYAVMGLMAARGLRRELPTRAWPFGTLFWLSMVASATGVWLYVVSHFVVQSVCIVCAATYVLNFGLLAVAAFELRRVGTGPVRALAAELRVVRSRPLGILWLAGLLGAVLVAGWVVLPRYWEIDRLTGPGGLPVGRTDAGHPWIGAREPIVEIIEFSDYQCPHCQRGHDEVRNLVATRPEQVRLVHRHYPLDHHCNPIVNRPFHPRACEYSRVAYCAGTLGRFWEANDYLYEHGRRRAPVTVAELAREIGLDRRKLATCVAGEEARRKVDADLSAGRAHGIRGTPTFVLQGRSFPGRIPPDVLDKALGD